MNAAARFSVNVHDAEATVKTYSSTVCLSVDAKVKGRLIGTHSVNIWFKDAAAAMAAGEALMREGYRLKQLQAAPVGDEPVSQSLADA